MAAATPVVRALSPSASPEEVAAIAAALERFARETAPPPAGSGEVPEEWMRAAMLEGVMRDRSQIGVSAVTSRGHADVSHPWINT